MAMSDCVKCWDTPCRCGHDYRNWSKESKVELILAVVGGVIGSDSREVLEEALNQVKAAHPGSVE